MSTIPEPAEAFDLALVAVAVRALRCFADDLTRAQAATLLSMWAHRSALSETETRRVLDHFIPAAPPVPHQVSGHKIGNRNRSIGGRP